MDKHVHTTILPNTSRRKESIPSVTSFIKSQKGLCLGNIQNQKLIY